MPGGITTFGVGVGDGLDVPSWPWGECGAEVILRWLLTKLKAEEAKVEVDVALELSSNSVEGAVSGIKYSAPEHAGN